MKKILFLLFPFFAAAQIQLGYDIQTQDNTEQKGWYVALSSNGQTMAVGCQPKDSENINFSRARIFDYSGEEWVQKGQSLEITGFVDNWFTRCRVSLSSDGNIVAIGSPAYGNPAHSGQVKVFQYDGAEWQQIGQDINGVLNDQLGYNIVLSSNGNILAIVASGNEDWQGNMGSVVTYQYNGIEWQQLGQKILGAATETDVYDVFQGSISLSADGTIMAIGTPFSMDDFSSNINGQVRVYQFDGELWQQKGQHINNNEGYNLGWDVSLSEEGNTLVTSRIINDGYGIVKAFHFVEGEWVQKGEDIVGEEYDDLFGSSVSMSADGNVIAVGAPEALMGGQVRLYSYNGELWQQIGENIDGYSNDYTGYDVFLTPAADFLAVGSPFYGTGGQARVYELEGILSTADFSETDFSVFPNPAQNYLYLNLKDETLLNGVSIYNSLGQLVKQSSSYLNDVSGLPAGVYYIKVITDQGEGTKTFIKQ